MHRVDVTGDAVIVGGKLFLDVLFYLLLNTFERLVYLSSKHAASFITSPFSVVGGAVVGRWTCHHRSRVKFPPGQKCITTLDKLFTPVCLCHQAV